MAEECMSNIEVLKKAHAKGRSVPKFHTEERTFNTIKWEHTHNTSVSAVVLQIH